MEHELPRSPEYVVQPEAKAEQGLDSMDYSSRPELEYIAKMLGLSLQELQQLSPEVRQKFEQAKNAVVLQENLINIGQGKIIDREIRELPIIAGSVAKEMRPIHQYFKLLIEKGKATKDDERAYFNKRYGWSDEQFDLDTWDNKLAKLNMLIRAKVCERISQEEFDQQLNAL